MVSMSTTVLGIKAYPQDNFFDYKDYRDNRYWQIILKMARRRDIKVIVRELGENYRDNKIAFRSTNGTTETIVINSRVPNWYKPKVLAYELAEIIIHRKEKEHSQIDIYNADTEQILKEYLLKKYYEDITELEVEKFACRIYRVVDMQVKREMKDFKSERLSNGEWKLFGKRYKN